MVAAINMRLAELPRQEEGANKELERTKSAPAFALAGRTAALAAQFRRWADQPKSGLFALHLHNQPSRRIPCGSTGPSS